MIIFKQIFFVFTRYYYFFQPGNTLCFQLVIISTNKALYAVHIYKTHDFSQVHFDNIECRTQAKVWL